MATKKVLRYHLAVRVSFLPRYKCRRREYVTHGPSEGINQHMHADKLNDEMLKSCAAFFRQKQEQQARGQ